MDTTVENRTETKTDVNIGFTERKVRLVSGVVLLALSIILSLVFIGANVSLWWSIVLLLTYYQGVRFLLDYRTGTCPLKAELRQSKLDGYFTILGERLVDEDSALQIRSKSRKALLQAVSLAVGLTLLTIVLMVTL